MLGYVLSLCEHELPLHACESELRWLDMAIGRHLYLAGRPSRWALAHISSYYYYFLKSPLAQSRRQEYYTTLFDHHNIVA